MVVLLKTAIQTLNWFWQFQGAVDMNRWKMSKDLWVKNEKDPQLMVADF